jgi:hypothetical protein
MTIDSKVHIQSWLGGMNLDLDKSVFKANTYSYAENVRVVGDSSGTNAVLQDIESSGDVTMTGDIPPQSVVMYHTDTIRNIGIVVTKNTNGTYSIYRQTFDGQTGISTRIINNANFGFGDRISTVCKWESDNNVKMYIADGIHQLMVVDVMNTYPDGLTPEDISIIPSTNIIAPKIIGYQIGGRHIAGKVQYACRFLQTRGLESAMSSVSKLIHISDNDTSSIYQQTNGSKNGEFCERTIVLSIDYPSQTSAVFDRVEIIRISYTGKTVLPKIGVIANILLATNQQITYQDSGSDPLYELTLEELNSGSTYSFIPKIIEDKDNILFAANIKEDTFNFDWDARAYRAGLSRMSAIRDSNGVLKAWGQTYARFESSTSGAATVPVEHACINDDNNPELFIKTDSPSSSDNSHMFTYESPNTFDGLVGGKGLNVAYHIVSAFVPLSIVYSARIDQAGLLVDVFDTDWEISPRNYTAPPTIKVGDSLHSTYETANINYTLDVSDRLTPGNFANANVDMAVRGYMHDEIYRFGIVFFDKLGRSTPVKWIGDIRMPSGGGSIHYPMTDKDGLIPAGNFPITSLSRDPYNLFGRPLGIRFFIRTAELANKGLVSYQIVRCERKLYDRTVVAQGVISDVTKPEDSTTLVPMPYLSYNTNHGYFKAMPDPDYMSKIPYYLQPLSDRRSNEIFQFISPEAAINGGNSSDILAYAKHLRGIYLMHSVVNLYNTSTSTWYYGGMSATAKVKQNLHNGQIIDNNAEFDFGDIYYASAGLKNLLKLSPYISGSETHYVAGLAKYYGAVYVNPPIFNGDALIDDIAYVPSSSATDGIMTNTTFIGNDVYDNRFYVKTDADKRNFPSGTNNYAPFHFYTNSGPKFIFQSKNMTQQLARYSTWVDPSSIPDSDPNKRRKLIPNNFANAVLLTNIKNYITPYGGNTYVARQNSVYIPVGKQTLLDFNLEVNETIVFDGDTYINIFDYANGKFLYDVSGASINWSDNVCRSYFGAYIPIESSINLDLRADDIQIGKTYIGGYANHLVQDEIGEMPEVYIQTQKLYEYNDAYSTEPIAKTFAASHIYNIDDLHSDTRVIHSEESKYNEVTDNYTKFKQNNYIDLDTKYGPITNLYRYNQYLYCFQPDAFSALAVNDRSLITDENMAGLVLGTGGVLTNYQYVSVNAGMQPNHLDAINHSNFGLYFIDGKRREIFRYANSLESLSKTKGVQSYLNTAPLSDNPVIMYDPKYNEVLFTIIDYYSSAVEWPRNACLVYNEQIDAFTSFYLVNMQHVLNFVSNQYIYQYDDTAPILYNNGDNGYYLALAYRDAKIEWYVNDEYAITKVFDNIQYTMDTEGAFYLNSHTFVTKHNSSQITNAGSSPYIDYREDTYRGIIPRGSDNARLRGKYLKQSLVMRVGVTLEPHTNFRIPFVNTIYRPSYL